MKKLKQTAKKILPQVIKDYMKKKRNQRYSSIKSDDKFFITRSLKDSYLKFKEQEQQMLLELSCSMIDVTSLPNQLLEILSSTERKLVIFPLNYDLKLGQRPDEILTVLGKQGEFNCLFLSYDPLDSDFKEISPGVFITSFLWEVLHFLKNQHFYFLFTHPRYMNFRCYFQNAVFIFDCLDEPTVLSDSSSISYIQDFTSAISGSDITLFSSQYLFDKYAVKSKDPLLLCNGINLSRYKETNLAIESDKVFGYVGVISELVDFEFLHKILDADSENKLLLIGPLKAFESKYYDDLLTGFTKLKETERVTHIPYVPKDQIANSISKFNFGVIPFIISDKTDGVLPLKLFEYMALGKPIISTRTRELVNFNASIKFYDGTVSSIVEFLNNHVNKPDYSDLLAQYSWDNLVVKLAEKIEIDFKGRDNYNQAFIDILNFQYFNFNGDYLYKGGAERYVYDLAKVIQRCGYRPRILQQSSYAFYQFVNKDIPVIGIPTYNGDFNDTEAFKYYYSKYFPYGVMAICSPFELSFNLKAYLGDNFPVIGINHGIYWDGEATTVNNLDKYFLNKVVQSVLSADNTICVDTNFINWLRTIEHQAARKTSYIPNYFDATSFKFIEKNFSSETVRICYPRRVYPARGSELLFAAIKEICSNFKNVVFDIVGQFNSESERNQYYEFKALFGDQLEHHEFAMNEMHQAYLTSHIVLIPTCYSEGTSLSCIEAMATNNAIIATNVGGLPNLIFNNFNGFLINPDPDDLIKSIVMLIQDRDLMKQFAVNAIKVAKTFELESWGKSWSSQLKHYLGAKD